VIGASCNCVGRMCFHV